MGKLKISIENQLTIAQEWIMIFALFPDVKPEDIQEEIASNIDEYPIDIFEDEEYSRLVIRFCVDRVKETGGCMHDETVSIMDAIFAARYGKYAGQNFVYPMRSIFPCYMSELEKHRQFLAPTWTTFMMPSYKQAGHILFVGTIAKNSEGTPLFIDKADIAFYNGTSFKKFNGKKLPYNPEFFQYLLVDPRYARYDDFFEPLFRVTLSRQDNEDAASTK